MSSRARIVVLTIDKLLPKELLRPTVLLARVPRTARLLGVNPVPNVLELLGMPSGGGPPGFSFLVPTLDEKEPKQPDANRFIIGCAPGGEVPLDPDYILGEYVGACVSAGFLINYFELVLNDDLRWDGSPEVLEAGFDKMGVNMLQLAEYAVSQQLVDAIRSKAQK